MVTRQLQVERRTGKLAVRDQRSTTVPRNHVTWVHSSTSKQASHKTSDEISKLYADDKYFSVHHVQTLRLRGAHYDVHFLGTPLA